MGKVDIVRRYNTIDIILPPEDLVLHSQLEKALTMEETQHLRGYEAKKRGRKVVIEYKPLFLRNANQAGLYTTFAGFEERVSLLLTAAGHQVTYTPDATLDFHQCDFDFLRTVQWRDAQLKVMAPIISVRHAQLDACTGAGKTFLIGVICRAFNHPDCRIVACTQMTNVFNGIHKRVSQFCPDEKIGRLGNGYNDNQRITISTFKSLKKVQDPTKVSIILCDEVHGAGANDAFSTLKEFVRARMYGFSASTECRGDGRNDLVEALFGKVKCHVTFQEGRKEGFIPPVKAIFYRLYCPPVTDKYDDSGLRKRYGVWENGIWNEALHRIARFWERELKRPDYEPQVLVMSDSSEHIFRMKGRYLDDYALIYRGGPNKRAVDYLNQEGSYPKGTPVQMKDAVRDQLTRDFEESRLKRVLSTTTLGTGVDAPGLDVIIRADGGASEISNIQFRGRVTRGESGIYCDLLVEGDEWLAMKSQVRLRSCRKAGWEIEIRDLPR